MVLIDRTQRFRWPWQKPISMSEAFNPLYDPFDKMYEKFLSLIQPFLAPSVWEEFQKSMRRIFNRRQNRLKECPSVKVLDGDLEELAQEFEKRVKLGILSGEIFKLVSEDKMKELESTICDWYDETFYKGGLLPNVTQSSKQPFGDFVSSVQTIQRRHNTNWGSIETKEAQSYLLEQAPEAMGNRRSWEDYILMEKHGI